ncbi:ABC transporter permease subunit [uncultured Ilyobacter sp.]|uniref:ABC transporter permease n=1 Tax=uncultured Ilyobacter sp. TaxID=544433 RepID=UPI0029C0E419|nr:ABC transporter permease subunit [uncultured Ilyobacter sp.]
MKRLVMKTLGAIIMLAFIMPFGALIYESLNLDSWLYIINDKKTYDASITTIVTALLTLFLNIILGTPAANILARKNFKGKNVIQGLIFLPLIIPSFVSSMGIYFTFIRLGLSETLIGVVFIHTVLTLPYYIHSTTIGYKTLNENYDIVGKMLGANRMQRFFYITLPHIMPSVIAGGSLVIIVSFAQYLNTLIIGGGKVLTIPILMFPYISGGNIKVGAVYSVLYIFINFSLLFILERKVKRIYNKKMTGDIVW